MEIEAEVAARPAVRVNQLGYLPFGPKTATLVGRAREPVEFTVVAEHGETAYAGRSRPWPARPEPTSGLEVHTLDFSDLTAAGGFRIVAGRAGSHAFRIKDQLYARLAGDALRFFYLQRSGCSIDDARGPG